MRITSQFGKPTAPYVRRADQSKGLIFGSDADDATDGAALAFDSLVETKARVASAAGARLFKQPIGSVIVLKDAPGTPNNGFKTPHNLTNAQSAKLKKEVAWKRKKYFEARDRGKTHEEALAHADAVEKADWVRNKYISPSALGSQKETVARAAREEAESAPSLDHRKKGEKVNGMLGKPVAHTPEGGKPKRSAGKTVSTTKPSPNVRNGPRGAPRVGEKPTAQSAVKPAKPVSERTDGKGYTHDEWRRGIKNSTSGAVFTVDFGGDRGGYQYDHATVTAADGTVLWRGIGGPETQQAADAWREGRRSRRSPTR